MTPTPDPRSRGGRVFPRFSVDEDVDREIGAHLELRAEELIAGGWEPDAAREEALRAFGDPDAVAEVCRDITTQHDRSARRATMLDELWQDLRFGFRVLRRSPGFAVIAVVTLALGIGANAAVFSVVNGVVLRPLPYEEPDRIVWLAERNNRGGTMSVAWPNFDDWRREAASFERLAAYRGFTTTVLGAGQPLRLPVANVTAGFWSVFRVQALTGRLSTESDHVQGSEPIVVISEALWRSQLGGRPIEGMMLELGTVRARVVGVVPSGFDYPGGARIWGVLEQVATPGSSRTSHNWNVVGRLRDGVTVEQAAQEMDVLTRTIVAREPDAAEDFLATGAVTLTLHDRIIGDSRTILMLLLGAAGLVLLVACTNLASTLLARGTHRARELAVRASMGAGRGRIVRQLLTESLVLAGLGGAAGVGLAGVVVRGLQIYGAESVPRLGEVTVDGWVLLYSAGIALGTAALFGMLPAYRLTRGEAGEALRAESRGNAGAYRGGIWRGLVATEVALALVLLVGSGLLVRSFQTLLAEDAGFDGSDVTTAAISLSRLKYETPEDHARFHAELLRELEGAPGVSAASVSTGLPIGRFIPNGQLELDGNLDLKAIAEYVAVTGDFFDVFDVPLLVGRTFEARDHAEAPHVAIVNAAFAERYWTGENPIGRRVTGGGMDSFWQDRPFAEVVGVVGNVRYRDLSREAEPTIYFPIAQRPSRAQFSAQLAVESSNGDPAAVAGIVRSTLRRLDSEVPVELATQESRVGRSLAERRFTMILLGGFSVIALLLAGVGIYGVVSYTVARRTREMGIRLALGATPGSVLQLIVGSSMVPVLIGIGVGVLGAFAASRALNSLLYGISASDPVTFVGVVLLIGLAGLLASWLPARGGTRVDPIVTMKAE